jgi:three-Cys-motif partner protein
VIAGDCNDEIERVLAELPNPSAGLLTFCFVDPFGLGIHLATIRRLKHLRIDFLVLVADQMAGARDVTLQRAGDRRVEHFLGDAEWRPKWAKARAEKQLFRDFLLKEFTARMKAMGFLAGEAHRIRVAGNRAFLYRLAFFSKNDRAIKFWDNARRNAPVQKQMELE